MRCNLRTLPGAASLAALLILAGAVQAQDKAKADNVSVEPPSAVLPTFEYQVPDTRVMKPLDDQVRIVFINRSQNPKEWDALAAFWNPVTEQATDSRTGKTYARKLVKIKVPLGLTQSPAVPPENPMTLSRWALGKKLYFDPILSSDRTVSCASCHDPRKGYTDQSPVSTGIHGNKGGVSAPTVVNAAYSPLQFWDGRAASLEEQAQGPPTNPLEMFDGSPGDAWEQAVKRIKAMPEYVQMFKEAYGTEPTRDAAAKAIATYERTVLSGNSIHDRADLAMRRRVDEEESGKFEIQAKDYEVVLKDAFSRKDLSALKALQLDPEKDVARVGEIARKLNSGRQVFFGKARCNSCHVGDNFTDNQFHNLGVGVKDGRLPKDALGRFARLPLGHKDPDLIGAFKTPTLRGLLGTGPYMHDGSEATLAKVVEFYDDGGRANEFLDVKMRDYDAEQAYRDSQKAGTPSKGPEVKLFGKDQKPIVPLHLKLTPEEKDNLVQFMRALEGDPIDPMVAQPDRMPE